MDPAPQGMPWNVLILWTIPHSIWSDGIKGFLTWKPRRVPSPQLSLGLGENLQELWRLLMSTKIQIDFLEPDLFA